MAHGQGRPYSQDSFMNRPVVLRRLNFLYQKPPQADATNVTLRIIVADDHPVVRLGARAYIESESAGIVVAEAGTTEELLELLSSHQCDLVVTDLGMARSQQPDGVELIRILRHDYPEIPIVVLTAHKDVWLWRALIGLGVLGLVDKTSAMPELPRAIASASVGARYVCTNMQPGILGGAQHALKLSPREVVVLDHIARGKSISEIATELNRATSTIAHQKLSAMHKLGVQTDQELYFCLARWDWLSDALSSGITG